MILDEITHTSPMRIVDFIIKNSYWHFDSTFLKVYSNRILMFSSPSHEIILVTKKLKETIPDGSIKTTSSNFFVYYSIKARCIVKSKYYISPYRENRKSEYGAELNFTNRYLSFFRLVTYLKNFIKELYSTAEHSASGRSM